MCVCVCVCVCVCHPGLETKHKTPPCFKVIFIFRPEEENL